MNRSSSKKIIDNQSINHIQLVLLRHTKLFAVFGGIIPLRSDFFVSQSVSVSPLFHPFPICGF